MNELLSINSDGFYISYRKISVNNMPRCHTHQCYELYYLIEGERYLFANKTSYTVRAGDIFLIAPGVEHRTLDARPGGYTGIVCNIPRLGLLDDSLKEDFTIRMTRASGEKSDFLKEQSELIRNGLSQGKRDSVSALIVALNLLNFVISEKNRYEEAISKNARLDRVGGILGYIEEHLHERITLTEISESFFISEFYLSRLFKECTGKNLWQYITESRIDRAKVLLISTKEKASSIGKKCGFGSFSAFSAAFKKTVGCSPMEYRKGCE